MPGKKRVVSVLSGDGIGPEVTGPAVAIRERAAASVGFDVMVRHGAIGGEALDKFGTPLEVLCRASAAVSPGAAGEPKRDANPAPLRPEKRLLPICKELALRANLRPVRQIPALLDCWVLKPEVVSGVDLIVVRELAAPVRVPLVLKLKAVKAS
jgi:3-isopropylmalate dehydrogenase